MDFKTLHETIPYVKGGKEKILTMRPYEGVTLAMPGRHAKDTDPVGGDFVVMVSSLDMLWGNHQFSHSDIFKVVAMELDYNESYAKELMQGYYDVVVKGVCPNTIDLSVEYTSDHEALHPRLFLYAVQCLAVAEHRRYAKYEPKFGGRYLPFRFAAGIVEGKWSAVDAANLQKKGRPGVEMLERLNGTPQFTLELKNG